MVVPVYDVVRVSLVRITHHVPIFNADKNHIHHKLMRTGLTQHKALFVILALALFYIALNVALWHVVSDMTFVVAFDVVVWLVFHGLINSRIKRNGQSVYLANTEE